MIIHKEGSREWTSLIWTVMNFRFAQNARTFLTRWSSIIFSKSILLHGGRYLNSYPEIHILYYITLHYTTLRYITLRYITLR